MLTKVQIKTARVFKPLLADARYKGAHGGRGSGKSHFFADNAVERCVLRAPQRILCGREVQKSLKESAKLLIEDKIERFAFNKFKVKNDEIYAPNGGVIIFQGMRDHNADTIKSYEGFDVAWVEEAHRLTAKSLQLLRPTIRKPGSELWFSWNPFRRSDPVDALLRGTTRPSNSLVVRANWSDNPWFPSELESERLHDLSFSPSYRHIWEGDYATVVEGAYFAKSLNDALTEGRICRVAGDPLQTIRVFCDLGGSSNSADAFAMWVAQFLGREIRVLDYYEAVGQAGAVHFQWLRDKGYEGAHIWLPHDGTQNHGPINTTWEGAFKDAGFPKVNVIKNQGQGAARQRIEAARRIFPSIWFNAETTEAGREALGAYHEKKDEQRQIGLGPEHDWASHGADAFGLMCIAYEPPKAKQVRATGIYTVQEGDQGTAWMGN